MKRNLIAKILNKPWAIRMLSLYNPDEAGKQILRWSEIRDGIKIQDGIKVNDKLLGERLKKLCEIGILIHKKRGYAYSTGGYRLNYIFKCEDMTLIQDCPVGSVLSSIWTYKKTKKRAYHVQCASIYGLEEFDPNINNILDRTQEKLRRRIYSIYRKKLRTIVDNECKIIKDEYLEELIRKWHAKLIRSMLLHPIRNRDKIEPARIQFDCPKEDREGFKVITERIWMKFYGKCPPIGIMLRF